LDHAGKRFIILDGSSLIFRAFFALPLLTSPTGEYTNAVYGFSNMLMKLLEDYQPDYLLCAFDKSRNTFRRKIYPDYKGTRDKTPAELSSQIPLLREFTEAMGIPFLEKEDYEADDIIGTLSVQAAEQGLDTLIVTGDRDALQLVRSNLRVMLTKKGISNLIVYDEALFEKEYQMKPIRLIDLKGLMGDTSDNIPGVPGVGPKTAKKLLVEYGSLENVLAHTQEIKGKKLQERLLEYAEQARLSKRLATIECAVPGLELSLSDCELHPDTERLQKFCERYELKTVQKNLQKLFSSTEGVDGNDQGRKKVSELYPVKILDAQDCQQLRKKKKLSVSANFGGRYPFLKIKTMAISDGAEIFILPENSAFLSEAIDLLEHLPAVIVFGWKAFCHAGVKMRGSIQDLELAAYLLQPEQPRYEIVHLFEQYFPEKAVPVIDEDIERMSFEAMALFQLDQKMSELVETAGLKKLYDEIELPLVPVLADMEQTGVYVNRSHLEEKAQEVAARVDEIQKNIYTLAGHPFNIHSPKQIGTVLFDELKLPVIKKTKTGYSTNAEVLEQLRYAHPIVSQILSYRLWTKLKSTYLDGIGELISPESGRVHTNFNQTVTATGRLSSSDPNLQNIPVRTEEGRQIRTLFEPGQGYAYMLSADYSQIELRLLAHMSGDEHFIDAFLAEQDIHARTASEVFHVPLDAVTPELRRRAKAVNFGIIYGISDYGLSKDLHISRKEAAHYIDEYFLRYPEVKRFLDQMVEEAHRTGMVKTMFGRRRELPEIKSRNYNQRTLAERMAMNTPIQGTAADIIKLAMIRVDQALKREKSRSRMILQVHDELVLEVPKEELESVTTIVKQAMEHVVDLKVPLLVDVNYGKNWAEAK
jgi:DNA polymerase-1